MMSTAAAFDGLQEVHCCQLESQACVYGLTKVPISSEETRLLVTSIRGRVLCVGFNDKMIPSSREVHFTYIPGDAEIVSADAFKKCNGGGIVVGIVFIKMLDGKPCAFLNIYSESDNETDLDQIAQGCQSISLSYLPYQLYHTEICHWTGKEESVFLLSGTDQRIHLYKETQNPHMFQEDENPDDFFPEFFDLSGMVLWMQCIYFNNNRHRLTAVGCENGFVRVHLVDAFCTEVLKEFQIQHDSPISSLSIFELVNHVPLPKCLSSVLDVQPESQSVPHEFHLLVCNSLEPAVVYLNILERGFSDPLLLPDSDSFDSVMCALVTDIDFDGENEIVLGTYGQELLVYKLQDRQPKSRKSSCNISTSGSGSMSDSSDATLTDGATLTVPGTRVCCSPGSTFGSLGSILDKEFALVCQRSMPEPVMALDAADLLSDGLNEIVIFTLKGLHILQHDLVEASELCVSRLNKLFQSSYLQTEFSTETFFGQLNELFTKSKVDLNMLPTPVLSIKETNNSIAANTSTQRLNELVTVTISSEESDK